MAIVTLSPSPQIEPLASDFDREQSARTDQATDQHDSEGDPLADGRGPERLGHGHVPQPLDDGRGAKDYYGHEYAGHEDCRK
jgi:hypothetical protein